MARLRDLNLARHLADPEMKPRFVTPMFDLVAPRYDDFTRLFSFGMDAAWKQSLLARALELLPEPRKALDLACGTGDLALALAALRPGVRVTGIDASTAMLALARATLARSRAGAAGGAAGAASPGVEFREGDLASLPAPDASAELVTVGYGFRNAELHPSLRECARVLRPGGVLAVLDFYRPGVAVWRAAFVAYLRVAGSLIGWWWHREPVAYGYIAHSVEAYVSRDEFTRAAERAGFRLAALESHLGGGVALHLFVRHG